MQGASGVRSLFLLLFFVIGILLTPAEARELQDAGSSSSSSSCGAGLLECDLGSKCLPEDKVCDFRKDCDDGRDEYGCFCRHVGLKLCRQMTECYDPKKECDGVPDCRDATDEENCPSISGTTTTTSPTTGGTQSSTTALSTSSPFFYTFSESNASAFEPFTDEVQIITNSREQSVPQHYNLADKPQRQRWRALPGFRSSPEVSTGPVCLYAGTRKLTERKPVDYCPCKKHVTGKLCDECKKGAFHLDKENKHGCLQCFCMNKSKVCTSSTLYRKKIKKKKVRCVSGHHLNPSKGVEEKDDSKFIECLLPQNFSGDKTTSYGGVLKMAIRNVDANATVELEIKGYGVVLKRTDTPRKRAEQNPKRKQRNVRVKLVEKNWKVIRSKSGRARATREDLLTALSSIESFSVRMRTPATFRRRITLRRVSMDVTTSNHSTSKGQALEVEECECPVGYTGTSCQTCSQGYRKVRVKYGPPEFIRFVCRKEKDSNLREIRRKKFCLEFHPGNSLPLSVAKIYNSYCVTRVDKPSLP